ncbi:YycH family regulatory protein [Robertmurraya korlensis]|uniref:YycH family regulatory protein n=1 Tax=Robertmurraya korlensis TaxID=519977 RepID=UPI000825CEB5|nr:two-component system activity regulator YycH [Robertmurraya korlensis]
MKYETIKSIVLLILVIFSILLTYLLWTYQPNYDTLKESGKTVEEVSLGETKELKNIVRPERLFLHQGDKHFGTFDSFEIEQMMKELSLWGFSEFEDISEMVRNIPSFIYDKNSLEIIFPDIVPLKVYRSALQLPSNEIPKSNFDRIVIDLEPETREGGVVYFISSKEHKVLRARVSASFITNYKERYLSNISENEKYALFEPINRESFPMLRKEPVKMALYKHISEKLPTDKLRDALFSDPNLVSKNYSSFGEEYTDTTTLMSVNYGTNTIRYIKTETDATSKSENLLERSIEFVNSHGGWTDNYRYVGMDESEQFILFRLYDLNGYPIFGDNGVSEILQIWNASEINKYYRSNLVLGSRVEATEINLPSGIAVLEELKKTEDFNLDFLQDITIGYHMTKDTGDTQNSLIHLEPSWYYKYNDEWKRVSSSVNGGEKHGLE